MLPRLPPTPFEVWRQKDISWGLPCSIPPYERVCFCVAGEILKGASSRAAALLVGRRCCCAFAAALLVLLRRCCWFCLAAGWRGVGQEFPREGITSHCLLLVSDRGAPALAVGMQKHLQTYTFEALVFSPYYLPGKRLIPLLQCESLIIPYTSALHGV